MSQKWYISHAESLVQNIFGLLIAFVILKLWGMTTSESISLQVIFFFSSYIRSYLVRRAFNKMERKNERT